MRNERGNKNPALPQPSASVDHRDAAIPPSALARLWSRTSLLKEVWGVLQTVGDWPGIQISATPSGLCLSLSGVTLGQVGWNGRIDLPFEPEVAKRLFDEDLASRDPDTDRVVFAVRTAADADRALWLFRLAYLSLDSGALLTKPPRSMRS
jgi:hypothetical protein